MVGLKIVKKNSLKKMHKKIDRNTQKIGTSRD